METTECFFIKCENLIDKYLDYAPIYDSQILTESQQMLTKIERIYQNESLKNNEKSRVLYIIAGLNIIRDSNSHDSEQNLLKSVS